MMKLHNQHLKRHTLEIMAFSKEYLGVDLFQHEGQVRWLNNADKLVNILRPGNQWGKTLVLGCIHIFHAMTKYELEKFQLKGHDEWMKADYTTLNFGKTYEIAKGVHETIVDLINGEYALVDKKTGKMSMNESKIKHAILKEYSSELPYIDWWNGSQTLTRSTDDIGSSFKRRRLAFASGDEIGDIPDIISVLNATVIPRVAFYQGKIHLIGTPQDPGQYQELIETAEHHMEVYGEDSQYYVQGGTMYENPGLSQDYVQKIENTADEDLRRRIIYGEFAETGERYFSLAQVQNAINDDLEPREDGVIEEAQPEGYYLMSVDFASVEDRTVIGIIRYDIRRPRMVYLRYFKGRDVPIPMQYQIVREVFEEYEGKARYMNVIFDAQALGGKIAEQNLKGLHGRPFPGKGISPADAKAQALGSLKAMFDDGRKVIEGADKRLIDVNPNWGGLELPNVRPLRAELEGYKLDDRKIRQDFVMMLAQAAWYITKRRKPEGFTRVRPIDEQRMFLGTHRGAVNI